MNDYEFVLREIDSSNEAVIRTYKKYHQVSFDYVRGYLTANMSRLDTFRAVYPNDFKRLIDRNTVNKEKENKFFEDSTTGSKFPLLRTCKYRGIEYNIYLDDYGQQEFAIIEGEEVSGGSFNTESDFIFAAYIDSILTDRILKELQEEEKND